MIHVEIIDPQNLDVEINLEALRNKNKPTWPHNDVVSIFTFEYLKYLHYPSF